MGHGVANVVLGRYYIDNWIMGSISLKHGLLIDATEISLPNESCITFSPWNPYRNEYLLEEIVA